MRSAWGRAFGIFISTLALASAPLRSGAHEGDEDEAPPIQEVIGDVGDVSFPISCEGKGVQATFDRGVALLHHMTYTEADASVDVLCAYQARRRASTRSLRINLINTGQPACDFQEA